MKPFDVAIIGAGAAGMMAAAIAGARGRRVVLIDHAQKLAEKIRISGGGRCNFTNRHATPTHYLSDNPHFCKSALARYTPQDFIALVKRHRIRYHEKHKGQLFCDDSSQQIIDMLAAECATANVHWKMPCAVHALNTTGHGFLLGTDLGEIQARQVVIASGGLSIPQIGASDFGYRIAKQFNLKIIPTRPALVPLTFASEVWSRFVAHAGIALPVKIQTQQIQTQQTRTQQAITFEEDLLFTHRGLSGPAILQISSYWLPHTPLRVNLFPAFDLADFLRAEKNQARKQINSLLAQFLPQRLAEGWLVLQNIHPQHKLAELADKTLTQLGHSLNQWEIWPSGTEGFRKAEVTLGGVDTRQLSQQTMAVNTVPGLYFIGEVVDMTGWLGGYNFQWAWASGHAAGMAL